MKKIVGIYCIKNLVSGKMYIGQSVNVSNRIRHHFTELRNKKHHSQKLQNSFNKHGEGCFIFGLIEGCAKEELNERELYWITFYNTIKRGYNNAEPTLDGGRTYSEEDKIKHSTICKQAHRKYPESYKRASEKIKETFKRKIEEGSFKTNESTTMNIRIYSKEDYILLCTFNTTREACVFLNCTKKRLNKVLENTVKGWGDEKKHISYKGYVILKGDFLIEDFIKKIQERKSIQDFNKTTEEVRLKKSIASSGKRKGKSIGQYTVDGVFVRTWDKVKEAAEFYNIRSAGIVASLRGYQKTTRGYVWKYL